MKTPVSYSLIVPALVAFSTFNSQLATVHAQGTAFTYQGRLNDGAAPADGSYDLRFTIYDSPGGGLIVGGPLTNSATRISNGLFTVTLDFGPGVFAGGSNWLEIAVQTNGGGFTPLAPRQQLTPVPYAVFANTASNLSGTLPAVKLTGTIPDVSLSGTYGGIVTFNNGANTFYGNTFLGGSFTGNGQNLNSLNANNLASGIVPLARLSGITSNQLDATTWQLATNQNGGNAASLGGLTSANVWQLGGNNVSAGQFLGSTNNQAVELRVGNQRALLITTNPADSANFIGGSPANIVDATVQGAVIAGGGTTNFSGSASSNHISSSFSSIGGGSGNWIQSGADHSFIGSGWNNMIMANVYQSVIVGGFGNVMLGQYSVIAGGSQNTNGSLYAAIGGGLDNYIQNSSPHSTISGGENNLIMSGAFNATIGGGLNNLIWPDQGATISGGEANFILGLAYYAVIGGGHDNTNSAQCGTIAGGLDNNINAVFGNSIGGGVGNNVGGIGSTIPGGYNNVVNGNYSFAAGQQAQATNDGTFVWADSHNSTFSSTANDQFSVRAQGGVRFVTGGAGMTLDGNPVLTGGGSFIAGSGNTNGSSYVAIGGGLDNYVQNASQYSTIGGGNNNLIMAASFDSTIGGGYKNLISGSAYDSTIAGGNGNVVLGACRGAVIGGGYNNTNGAANIGTVAGGMNNLMIGIGNTIGGGSGNNANGLGSTIPGGYNNVVNGNYSFAAGQQAQATNDGTFVWADSQNVPFASTTSNQFLIRAQGGVGINTASTPDNNFSINTNTYLFSHAIYLRGESGTDLNHGLAYNGNAVTNFGAGNVQVDGPVLWGFNGGALGTANGGQKAMLTWNTSSVGIGTNNPAAKLQVTSNGGQSNPQLRLDQTTSGDYARLRMVGGSGGAMWDIAAGGGSPNAMNFFVSPTIGGAGTNVLILQPNGNATFFGTVTANGMLLASDRNTKENFTPLDSQSVLAKIAALPISEWDYKTDGKAVQHIGPMAQDFHAAFGLDGKDDKHISVVDEGGVALAAIQGLNQKLEETRAENAELKQRNESLEERLNALEQIILKQPAN